MTREILFRGKGIDNGEWVFGDLIRNLIYDGREKEMRIGDIYFEHNGDIHGTAVYKVIPETVGQFTGLTDRNRNKIFEGDIVYNGVFKAQIELINGRFFPFCSDTFFADECEVIGNIYDNEELLENDKDKG